MKNKVLFSIIMISFALFVLIGSIMLIGNLGGLFGTERTSGVVSSYNAGSVTLIRRSAGYELQEGILLNEDDQVKTVTDSFAQLKVYSSSLIALDENSVLSINDFDNESVSLEMNAGTTFFHISFGNEANQIIILYDDVIVTFATDAVLSVEVVEGTQTLGVYSGSVNVLYENKTYEILEKESFTILQDEDGNSSFLLSVMEPSRLSGFLINHLLKEEEVCFSKEELTVILEKREAETLAVKQEQEAHEAEVLAQGGTVAVIAAGNTQKPQESEDEPAEEVHVCTIQIRCDTILDNLDKLTADKEQYVPDNGIILETSKVEFLEGESVYDVLKRVCTYSGIHLSYDWTVEYGGYYIEGINHLYEFDCGVVRVGCIKSMAGIQITGVRIIS